MGTRKSGPRVRCEEGGPESKSERTHGGSVLPSCAIAPSRKSVRQHMIMWESKDVLCDFDGVRGGDQKGTQTKIMGGCAARGRVAGVEKTLQACFMWET